MRSLAESLLTSFGQYSVGNELVFEDKECIVVYNDGKEAWLLSDYIYSYTVDKKKSSIITCYKDERNKYNKDGWAIPGVSEMIKINDTYLSKLPKDKFLQLFPKSIWVNNDRSGRAMKYNYMQRKTIYPESYTTAGIKLLKRVTI